MTATAQIEVTGLVVRYGAVPVVGPISFTVAAGQQTTLLGPSGCGKTTTLRAIAGLEKPVAGRIEIGGRVMFDGAAGIHVPAERRGLSMVFQSYAIWPHMTVFDNVAYGLRVRRKSAAEIRQRVAEALDLVQMGEYAGRMASQLSGGQQQRVALARACAFSPNVLLFDEPLSNLDAKLRADMRVELRELQHRLGVTSVYVTHDLEEALAMSDTIIVMKGGDIEQSGSAADIYNRPRTRFVADFVGSANLISGELADGQGPGDAIALRIGDGQVVRGVALGRKPGATPTVSVRTVHFMLSRQPDTATPNNWPVTVRRSVFLGDMRQIHVNWAGQEIIIRQTGGEDWQAGEPAFLSVAPGHCILLEGG
jgi:ABC-type Fe3+/spermidine/putrescine transport system ATPase subunit